MAVRRHRRGAVGEEVEGAVIHGQILVELAVLVMTREISSHDRRPGPGLFSFVDQVGKRLIHERLKLTAFPLPNHANSRQNLGINLRSEFFTGLGHGTSFTQLS